jgi:hypothetical protein
MDRGNCWTYAVPHWWRYGGYLVVRIAPGIKILNFIPVLHVIWCLDLKDAKIKQFVPVKRVTAKWFPFHTIFFRGRVITSESDRFVAKPPKDDSEYLKEWSEKCRDCSKDQEKKE